jgi:hypothetical protein
VHGKQTWRLLLLEFRSAKQTLYVQTSPGE